MHNHVNSFYVIIHYTLKIHGTKAHGAKGY